MNIYTSFFWACFLSLTTLQAQSIFINNEDGTTSNYSLEEVQRITFENESLVLLLFSGTEFSFSLTDLANYSYDTTLSATHFIQQAKYLDFSVYPNPVKDIANVQFYLVSSTQLTYRLLDLQGRIILESPKEQFNQGKNNFSFSLEAFSAGTYILQIQGDAVRINHTIIKK